MASRPDAECNEEGVYTVPLTGGIPTLGWTYDLNPDCETDRPTLGLGTYLPDGRELVTWCAHDFGDGFCRFYLVPMNGLQSQSFLWEVDCLAADAAAGRCSTEAHLSDARTGPAGSSFLFDGRGGYAAPQGTLPGSSPNATTERIYTMDVAGTRLRTVSTATSGYSPVLSPDGKTVLFTQASGSKTNLMKSGTASSSVASVFIANASQADWQPVR